MADLPDIPKKLPATELPGTVVGELEKARYQKQLDIAETVEITRQDTAAALENTRIDKAHEVENARIDKAQAVMEARADADSAAEVALLQAVHDGYIEVCKASLERSLTRATFLTTAITGVSTVYTTLLGVTYAVGTQKTLPARALVPVLFLGIALLCAAVYVAFLHGEARDRQLLPSSVGGDVAEERLKTFMEWTFSGVLARSWAIRTAIIAFAVGIMLLPTPFVAISGFVSVLLGVLGVAVIIAWLKFGEPKWGESAPGVPDPPALAESGEPAP